MLFESDNRKQQFIIVKMWKVESHCGMCKDFRLILLLIKVVLYCTD